MPVEYESPKIKSVGDVITDFTITHPSYATISVTHPEGTARKLFMSDLKHDRTVHISIHRAEQNRGLHSNWLHEKEALVDFEMSYSQWAQLVASSMGNPVPITLRRLNVGDKIESIPYISDQDTEAELTQRDIASTIEKTMKEAEELNKCIRDLRNKGKAGKKDLEELFRLALRAYEHLPGNIQFAAGMFKEYQETLITEAKTEIESHIGETIKDAGLLALSKEGYFDGKHLEHKEK